MFRRVAFLPQFRSSRRRALVGSGLLLGVALGLSACGGLFRMEQRAAWRGQAEAECLASNRIAVADRIKSLPAINRGACGMDHPLQVTALGDGQVGLKGKLVLACPMLVSSDKWFRDVVQPAAELILGTQIAEVKAGSYSCRTMNNQAGAKTSEHAFGNALDIMGFKTADGRDISVKNGWKGQPEEQEFLREVFVGACRMFGTVLGPGSNAFHYDHIHLDLARHNPAGTRRICQPLLKYAPRLDPDRPATPVRRPVPLPQPDLGPPQDIEDDPFVSDQEMAQRQQAQPETALALREPARLDVGAPLSASMVAAPRRQSVPAQGVPPRIDPPAQAYARPLAPPAPMRQSYGDARPVPPSPIPNPYVPAGSLGVLRVPASGPQPRPYAYGGGAGSAGSPVDLRAPGIY